MSWGIRKVTLHVGFLPYCFEIPPLVSFPNPLSPAFLCLAVLWIFPLKFPLARDSVPQKRGDGRKGSPRVSPWFLVIMPAGNKVCHLEKSSVLPRHAGQREWVESRWGFDAAHLGL